ncbi:MAG: sigma-54-dependent Fis family transcriptional regulator [Rhodopirellula sp.]|nr:sigma-54-dependent Fis family transcriptional regulator [Rhodopirellula sp.]
MSHVLVVDDEPAICWGFRELLREDGHDVTIASSAEEALRVAPTCMPDTILLDVRLPGMDGLTAIRQLKEKSEDAPVVVMTAFGNLETAVRAVEQGAFDYLTKPFELADATDVVRRALEHRQASVLSKDAAVVPGAADAAALAETIVGSSPAMQAVFRQIAFVAQSDAPVLIMGESGTGKELVARAIHRHSSRGAEPFMPVSLAAMNAASVESELFGHVKGAFSGATTDRKGILEVAGSGTILLDEIGDVPVSLQLKLLRTIEHHEIIPVGSAKSQRCGFRVLAATNRDLGALIEEGMFRKDLYFRLSVVRIDLPPLRERAEDIPDLARHFLSQMSGDMAGCTLSSSALLELSGRAWPGNVRELRNAVEHAAIMARGGTIEVAHLPVQNEMATRSAVSSEVLQREISRWTLQQLQPLDSADSEATLYEELLQLVEPALLNAVLAHCRNNRAAAARLLGLHRATLRQKLKNHGITGEDEA